MAKISYYDVMIYRIDESSFQIYPRSVSYTVFYRIKNLLCSNGVKFGVTHFMNYFDSLPSSCFVIQAYYKPDNIKLYSHILDSVFAL